MRKNPNILGVALIIISSIGFGLAPTFAKFSYDSGANAVGTLLARFSVATLLMLVVREIISRKKQSTNQQKAKQDCEHSARIVGDVEPNPVRK